MSREFPECKQHHLSASKKKQMKFTHFTARYPQSFFGCGKTTLRNFQGCKAICLDIVLTVIQFSKLGLLFNFIDCSLLSLLSSYVC